MTVSISEELNLTQKSSHLINSVGNIICFMPNFQKLILKIKKKNFNFLNENDDMLFYFPENLENFFDELILQFTAKSFKDKKSYRDKNNDKYSSPLRNLFFSPTIKKKNQNLSQIKNLKRNIFLENFDIFSEESFSFIKDFYNSYKLKKKVRVFNLRFNITYEKFNQSGNNPSEYFILGVDELERNMEVEIKFSKYNFYVKLDFINL